ncbi:MAG: septum formation inhibitor Maf [Gammaproteobacteria bacterium]|nr:septum formation inhibitor Maf [Gammaproteobacteria bacterium]
MPVDVILASASPRRAELLQQLGVRFAVRAADVPETLRPGETPREFVQRLAREKARKVYQSLESAQQCPVIGADTVVVIDEHVLGKPASREDAIAMLLNLSGRSHTVMTGVAVVSQQDSVCVNVSAVRFRVLDPVEIQAYWQTGEPADKAGAYAIQGYAAAFIEHLSGSYSGVMGLPLYETSQLLRQHGVPIWQAVTKDNE